MVDIAENHVEILVLAALVKADDLRRDALEWATTRGSRSGRVAWQFIQDLAGRLEAPLRD